MVFSKRKGYRTERKVRVLFEQNKWRVVRAGGSLGEADLVCIKNGSCILLQVKSSNKKALYYYGYMQNRLEGFKFFVVVDFGYRRVRIIEPKRKIAPVDGVNLADFLEKNK